MRKTSVVALAVILGFTLTGCGESWEELAENKKRCEALGGVYDQWEDGMYYGQHSECIFDGGKEARG